MRMGPMAVRTSFDTLLSTASSMRRTCRFRPSAMVISRCVCFGPSRRRFTSAGRVGAVAEFHAAPQGVELFVASAGWRPSPGRFWAPCGRGW